MVSRAREPYDSAVRYLWNTSQSTGAALLSLFSEPNFCSSQLRQKEQAVLGNPGQQISLKTYQAATGLLRRAEIFALLRANVYLTAHTT